MNIIIMHIFFFEHDKRNSQLEVLVVVSLLRLRDQRQGTVDRETREGVPIKTNFELFKKIMVSTKLVSSC